MMRSAAGEEEHRPPPSPITDAKDEERSPALWNHLSLPSISVLDKLIKTCPVWLQLCMNQERAGELLRKEPAGVFLVRRDGKGLVLSVHFSTHNEVPDIRTYKIKEEKSILYLEGSVLVFEDIFKLIAFYCVSRDVLPFTLRLPRAISEAHNYTDLEIVSNLGTGFWDSSLNHRGGWETGQHAESSVVSNGGMSRDVNQCSCEIELSIGNDRLWFVNPIFIEECSNPRPPDELPTESCKESSKESLHTPVYRRPPPPPPSSPPPQLLKSPKERCGPPVTVCTKKATFLQEKRRELKVSSSQEQRDLANEELPPSSEPTPKKFDLPSIPPRRRFSEKCSEESPAMVSKLEKREKAEEELGKKKHHVSFNCPGVVFAEEATATKEKVNYMERQDKAKDLPELQQKPTEKLKPPPVPPPRKKRLSLQIPSSTSNHSRQTMKGPSQNSMPTLSPVKSDSQSSCQMTSSGTAEEAGSGLKSISSPGLKGSDGSLNGSTGGAVPQTPVSEQDSYSTSSTEDDLEHLSSPSFKKTPSIMLGRAKHRLSLVTLSNVFTAFLSADKKMQKKLTELAQDKTSYFGNLVQDYRAYSLEMMAKQSSSTEMLQEIRLMMTQLKCYLIQSAELKSIIDPSVHSEDKIEAIVEAALCKCVLKPLKQAIESYLLEIHSKDGALRLLKENQQVIQATTTTDLGVTTSVPDGGVMEKIIHKFTLMHRAYSPEKKVTCLLKSCKLIYESMSTGNPGKPYGADDFLPVLMYVLAHCDLTELLVDVEYMMELMDPSLQLGEGSYYLTTTYGALEHIKNYDRITVTRQLSVEVQDSIHRWERRRTLNRARVSRSSVQLCS
uniref:Ras and Rab interactor 3 isoform X2 n=1 Tax=Geotrypetes seraphini TaxID=260995 RepID=A0A6P8RW08_GEOSA|nr:ras and Rab interactor 3 isoform X2 [Geotrypetes seraphini]